MVKRQPYRWAQMNTQYYVMEEQRNNSSPSNNKDLLQECNSLTANKLSRPGRNPSHFGKDTSWPSQPLLGITHSQTMAHPSSLFCVVSHSVPQCQGHVADTVPFWNLKHQMEKWIYQHRLRTSIWNQDHCITVDSAHLLLSHSHTMEVAALEGCARKRQHDKGGSARGKGHFWSQFLLFPTDFWPPLPQTAHSSSPFGFPTFPSLCAPAVPPWALPHSSFCTSALSPHGCFAEQD